MKTIGKLFSHRSSTGADDELTDEADTYYEVKFGQVTLAGPTITEQDGVSRAFDPREARLRSLTYARHFMWMLLALGIRLRTISRSGENGGCKVWRI